MYLKIEDRMNLTFRLLMFYNCLKKLRKFSWGIAFQCAHRQIKLRQSMHYLTAEKRFVDRSDGCMNGIRIRNLTFTWYVDCERMPRLY